MAVENTRNIVKEIRFANVIFQIAEKVDPQKGKVYYDFRVGRILQTADGEKTGPWLQQRDGLDLIAGATELLKWISESHRQNRNAAESDQQ
jgi:hypothetical protein